MDWRRFAQRAGQWLQAGRGPVRDVDGLAEFLSRHAAYIAQKCADDYCRNKVGVSHYALGEEAAYRAALGVCRWEGYAAVLAGLIAVTQRFLLAAGCDAVRLEAMLVTLYRRILEGHPLPPHRSQGWDDAVAALPGYLRTARERVPAMPLAEVAADAGRRLFEVLPIHESYREHDEPVVIGSVHFNFVAFSDRFRRRVDTAALAADVTSAPETATGPGRQQAGSA